MNFKNLLKRSKKEWPSSQPVDQALFVHEINKSGLKSPHFKWAYI